MDYNKENIEKLLSKYWEGETTLEEEITLQEYFNNGAVAEEFKTFQPLFQYFKVEKKHVLADEELDMSVIQTATTSAIRPIRRRRWFNFAKIAASITLIFAIGFWMIPNFQEQSNSPCGELSPTECQDAMKALEETKIALKFISSKLNYGAKKASEGLDKLKHIETKEQ